MAALGWRFWALFCALALAVGCNDDSDDDPPPPPPPGTTDVYYPNGHPLSKETSDAAVQSVEEQLLTLCNDHRIAMTLNALIHDESVRNCARAHCQHMVIHDFFDHLNPEGDTPGDRLTGCSVGWSVAGENIAVGYTTAQDAFNGWLASPGHKANLEDPAWTHTGLGYHYDGSDAGTEVWYYYYTQVFTVP